MEIGNPQRIYTIEPVVDPIPARPDTTDEPPSERERKPLPAERPTQAP
jgi:hypothetical protein